MEDFCWKLALPLVVVHRVSELALVRIGEEVEDFCWKRALPLVAAHRVSELALVRIGEEEPKKSRRSVEEGLKKGPTTVPR